jgi:hypothetical protein
VSATGLSAAAECDGVFVSARLEDRRQQLTRRLEDGYERIDQAALAGADVREWEEFWIKLLREYEQVCFELELAA